MDFSIRSIGGLEWMLERGMIALKKALRDVFRRARKASLPVPVMIFNPSWVALIIGVD